MREVTVSKEERITLVQPVNQWVDTYSTLELRNLTVIGGRVAEIGTGGLTLGGMYRASIRYASGIV
jgi:hypothetical protein